METIRQTGAVALVLALLLLTLWWLRKRGLAGMTGSLPLRRNPRRGAWRAWSACRSVRNIPYI